MSAAVPAEGLPYLSRHYRFATYPQPLSYEKPLHQKVKEGMAIEISRDMMSRFPNAPASEDESGIRLVLDEEQKNYILGRRIKGEGYPRVQ